MIKNWLENNPSKAMHYCYRPDEIKQEQQFSDDLINFVLCSLAPQNVLQFSFGSDIIFNILRKRSDIFVDMGVLYDKNLMSTIKHNTIVSLYSQKKINQFDIIGISLYYVGAFFNIIPFLINSKTKLLAKDRINDNKLIIAGGGAISANPEPIADIFDIIVIGDGEEPINILCDLYNKDINKLDFLNKIKKSHKSFYIPILKNKPVYVNCETKIGKYILTSDDFVSKPRNKVIELIRGCYYKCNFCQLGFMKNIITENNPKDVIKAIESYPETTSIYPFAPDESSYKYYDEIYKNIGNRKLYRYNQRINTFNQKARQSLNDYRIVFGIDGISQRIREIVKKQINTEQIYKALEFSFKSFDLIKLNLIIAYPFELEKDWIEFEKFIEDILIMRRNINPEKSFTEDEANYCRQLNEKGKKIKLRDVTPKEKLIMLHLAPTPFQPEPHTPMEYMGLGNIEYASQRLLEIKKKMMKKYGMIKIEGLNSKKSMETTTIIKHGGKELLNIFYNVYKQGYYNSGGLSSLNNSFLNSLWKAKLRKNKYLSNKNEDHIYPYNFIITGNENLKEKRKLKLKGLL